MTTNFRAKDKDGNLFFVEETKYSFTLRSDDGSTQIELFDRQNYIGKDKNGRDVYYGDTIITPKKKFKWLWETHNTHGEEMKIMNYVPFTRRQLAIIVADSVLKEATP